MEIRKSTLEDYDSIQNIYVYAREQMKKAGNPQWGDNNPSSEIVRNDIINGISYVCEHEGTICAVFVFLIGDEPTYHKIREGNWLNDKPYGVIHRLASNGLVKGVVDNVLKFCESKISNIRIDTHEKNLIMQHILEKNGFIKCGLINVEDGTERIAYQK